MELENKEYVTIRFWGISRLWMKYLPSGQDSGFTFNKMFPIQKDQPHTDVLWVSVQLKHDLHKTWMLGGRGCSYLETGQTYHLSH